MTAIELHVPADVAYVGLARLVVTTAARQCGMEDGRIEDLKIAVSEATTGAIFARREAGRRSPVVLAFGPGDGAFEVMIQDTASGADAAALTGTDGEADEPAGDRRLGVMVIRGLTDAVDFVPGEGDSVHMRFAIRLMDNGKDPED